MTMHVFIIYLLCVILNWLYLKKYFVDEISISFTPLEAYRKSTCIKPDTSLSYLTLMNSSLIIPFRIFFFQGKSCS